ncbi:MAG: hypothetical protein COV35_06235 [Alphaproteobacteria bacterium CG11_big_fil_rev_8_21_14_0_20_39_49]|nr:MAG: hypothetical protein COV35_06235 [Alphaproteobacteria bacterium CG11_big_fil_rev_8_21_14_0_20_39_49]
MLPFPDIEQIRSQFSDQLITDEVYFIAKTDYDSKIKTETHLYEQFKKRGLTEEEVHITLSKFLVQETVFLALHTQDGKG